MPHLPCKGVCRSLSQLRLLLQRLGQGVCQQHSQIKIVDLYLGRLMLAVLFDQADGFRGIKGRCSG